MSEKIAMGDLVMIVRGHECVVNKFGGIPFVVTGLHMPYGGGWHCSACHLDNAGPNELGADGLRNGHVPVSWLKKINPRALEQSTPTKETICA